MVKPGYRQRNRDRSIGLLVPMRSQQRRLSAFTAVAITFRAGDSDSPDKMLIVLRAPGGKDFTIGSPAQFGEARKQAECLARFLHLPLADTTTDHETVVSPDRAGETLRDRLIAYAAPAGRPLPPARLRSEVNQSSGEATIVIRGRRISGMATGIAVSFSAVLLLLAIPTVLRVFANNGSSPGVRAYQTQLCRLGLFISEELQGSGRLSEGRHLVGPTTNLLQQRMCSPEPALELRLVKRSFKVRARLEAADRIAAHTWRPTVAVARLELLLRTLRHARLEFWHECLRGKRIAWQRPAS